MKRIKEFSLLFGMSALLVVLVGCNQASEPAENNDDEEVVVSQELIDEGEKVVNTSCIGCHGGDLTGDMGPNLHNLALTEEEIIEVLIKGQGSMPPATANGNEEAVAAYLLTLK